MDLPRLDDLPTWLLSRASGRAHGLLQDAFREAGSRGYAYRLLVALAQVGPASQADLGRSAELDRSDVVTTLNALAADGFVERRPDPSDGRRNIVALTDAGRRELDRLQDVVAAVQEQVLHPLDPAERRTLLALLRKLR